MNPSRSIHRGITTWWKNKCQFCSEFFWCIYVLSAFFRVSQALSYPIHALSIEISTLEEEKLNRPLLSDSTVPKFTTKPYLASPRSQSHPFPIQSECNSLLEVPLLYYKDKINQRSLRTILLNTSVKFTNSLR